MAKIFGKRYKVRDIKVGLVVDVYSVTMRGHDHTNNNYLLLVQYPTVASERGFNRVKSSVTSVVRALKKFEEHRFLKTCEMQSGICYTFRMQTVDVSTFDALGGIR